MQPSSQGALLFGAVVQQAHIGERGALLKVRQPGATSWVVVVAGRGVGMSAEKAPKPAGAPSWTRLEGFRVAWLRDDGVGLARGDERARIAVGATLSVTVAPDAWDPTPAEIALAEDRDAWLAKGGVLATSAAADALAARRTEAARALKKATQRLARRADAVRGDLAKMKDAEAMAQHLPWLVAEASRVPRGARSIKVTDWSTGEAREIEFPLDPAKPARAQVDAMFQRARRLKQGAKVAEERLAHAERIVLALAPIAARVAAAESIDVIDAAITEARALAPKDVKLESASSGGGRGSGGQERSPPFRTFHARDGARVLVGRGAVHNDALTFQIGRPHDLWLHTKDRAGAHVIVPLSKGRSCPPDVLADAAHLAAHFSESRDETVVDVQYTPRRYLRKPRGSAPGLVVVDREKVIAVRIDPAVMRALLDSEEA
jgi:hypothetical protein